MVDVFEHPTPPNYIPLSPCSILQRGEVAETIYYLKTSFLDLGCCCRVSRGPGQFAPSTIMSVPTEGGVGGTLLAAFLLLEGLLVAAEDMGFVVMIPGGSGASEGYNPFIPAFKSVLRLAAEHVGQDEVLSETGNVSFAVVESADSATSAANLCSAIGSNDTETYAVSALLPDTSYFSFYQ